MEDVTLKALIHLRAKYIIKNMGWPSDIEADQRYTDLIPGWMVLFGRIKANDIVTLLKSFPGDPEMTDSEQKAIAEALKKLPGTEAEIRLSTSSTFSVPSVPGDFAEVVFPYAFQWLTEAEINAVKKRIGKAVRSTCIRIAKDAKIIEAALKPSGKRCLFRKQTRHFSLVAEETEGENFLDESFPEELERVLQAIMEEGARYCVIRLMIVNEFDEAILAYDDLTDVLRKPGEPVRKWLDRHILHEVVTFAREEYRQSFLHTVEVK